MRKILISLAIIGAVGAIVAGVTTAYFSDTETSTGNTFTAGSIDLKVDNHCYYNGDECACTDGSCTWQSGPNQGEECTCTWELTDLTDQKFFDYSDLKPGDYGENTVSLHVDNNDAWACVTITKTTDSDVDCTEPETESNDDASCSQSPPVVGDGELDENLNWMIWADVCDNDTVDPGDNVYQPGCDVLLTTGSASEIGEGVRWALADKDENNVGGNNGDPLAGSQTYYIGAKWCLGTFNENGTCNGQSVGNEVQTDSLAYDISFYVEQARNNPDFNCENLD